jgi:hypothetical protein
LPATSQQHEVSTLSLTSVSMPPHTKTRKD